MPAWRERAACRGMGFGIWFSRRLSDQAVALEICSTCPVLGECRTEVMADEGRWPSGVRGGLTARERWRIRRGTRASTLPAAALQTAGT